MLIYKLSYLLLLSFSIMILWIFRPFTYVDNFRSQIYCPKNNVYLQAGANFVFALKNGKLDQFNDIKARKLCEYSIIMDYNNTYQTPSDENYRFIPVIATDSSWLAAGLLFLVTFSLGSLVIETVLKTLTHGSNFHIGKQLYKFLLYLIS